MNMLRTFVFFMTCCVSATAKAHAASPTSNVGTARVDEGVLNVESRFGLTESDSDEPNEQWRFRQHLDYGFNDWYALRVIAAQAHDDGPDVEFDSLSFENRFQLIEKAEHGFDAGFRLGYSQSDGDKTPHEIDVRLLANVPLTEKWEFRSDSIFERDVGANAESGIKLELRHQVTHKWALDTVWFDYVRLGAEMFNDFAALNDLHGYETQDHQLGPVAKLHFRNGSYLQAGYRTGIARDVTDHAFKLFVGTNF